MLNDRTICKPLNPRELDFYQNIPQDIQMFVPQYKGKFHVKISHCALLWRQPALLDLV
jgi:hypothetical protein